MAHRFGRDCVTNVLVGDTWKPWGTITEQNISRTAETVDADCRDGDGRSVNARRYGADAAIGHNVEVTQTVKLRKDDAILALIYEKVRTMETIEAKVGDGSCGLDVNGVFMITSASEPQTLKDVVKVEVTLSLVEYKTYT